MTFRNVFALCLAILAGGFFAGASTRAASLILNDASDWRSEWLVLAQSFTTPADGTSDQLTGFRFFSAPGVPAGPGAAYLLNAEYLGTPAALGAAPSLMATGSWNPATQQYEFSGTPILAAGTQYWLYADAANAAVGLAYSVSNSHAGGQIYYSDSGSVFAAYADSDMLFEVLVAAPAPAVTAIAPASGSTAGGISVTLTGTDFTGATAVAFGASAATTFTVDSNTQITVTSPARSAGTVNITVTTSSGTSATAAANQFTYVTPNMAPTFVGATTTLTVAQNSAATDITNLLHVNDPDSSQTETWTTSSGPSHGTLTVTGATASSGSTDIAPGGTITYAPSAGYSGADSFTIQVSDGSVSATRTISVTVSAPTISLSPASLPAATAGSSYSQAIAASGGTPAYAFGVTAGALPPGLSLSSTGVLSGTPTTEGTFNFTVTATDSSTGTGPFAAARSYSLTVNPAADLAVAVTAPASLAVGSNLSYTITVTNSGPSDAANVSLTHALPTGTTFVSALPSQGSVSGGGPFALTFGTLAGGASASATIVVNVPSVPAGGTLSIASGTLASDTADPTAVNDSGTASVSILSNDATLSNLTLSAGTLSPSFASGTTDYTASVANAVSTIDVTATCAQAGATIKINGTSAVSGSARTIALNVGDNTITIVVTAQDGTTTKTYTVVVNRAPAADLGVMIEHSSNRVSAGGKLTYTITVANNGPQAAVSPALSDMLPAGTTYLSFSAPGNWSATTPTIGDTGAISATTESLASGATAEFTLVVIVDTSTSDGVTLSNTVAVSSTTADPDTANNADTALTTVTAEADLRVAIAPTPVGGASAGEVATYAITVTNRGPAAAGYPVVYAKLSGRLTFESAAPDADATAAGWTLYNSPGQGTQDDIYFMAPALANGASATLVIQAKIDSSASQGAGVALYAVAVSSTPDPDMRSNERTLNTLVGPAFNASTATALTNVATGTRVTGHLYPAGHVDAYSFTARAGDRVFAATATTASSDATNSSRDTVLRIARSDGVVLEVDDDDGGLSSTSSSIAGLEIPLTGTYYVVVECLRPEAIVFPYDLYLRVHHGAPANETADSATGQTLPASGWVAGATSAGDEVDSYTITLAAGETLFASLDLDPGRSDAGWDARLTLKPLGGDLSQSFQMNGSDLNSVTAPSSEAMMLTVKDPGNYVLEISSADGSSGNYQLSTSVLAAPVESTHGFTATDSNVNIPDGGELTSTLTIPSSLPIGRLKVALHIDHSDIPSLDIHLTSPSGNTIGLVRDVGVAGNNVLDAVFDDNAAYALGFDQQDPNTPLLTTRGAVFKPGRNYRLGWFSGQDAQGTWTLTVRDRNADTATGTLVSWSLIVVDEDPAPTGIRTDHFSTDFESDDGGFTHSGTDDQWGCGTPSAAPITTAHSGTKAWKTNLTGSYETSSVQELVSPNIDLTGVTPGSDVELSWAMSYQLADASTAGANVSVEEVDGDHASQVVWRWLGPTMQDTGVGIGSLTIDEAAGWALHRALINDFAGKTIRLRFHLESHDADSLAGLAIDDVAVSSYRAVSTDATLSNLVLSAGTLSPVFAGGTTSYTASVANGVSSITVTPAVADANATVKVNGSTVTSGNPSSGLALNVGANTISVVVTAEDGTTIKTYAIAVTRAAPSGGGSSDPTPATVTLSGLSVPFDGTPKTVAVKTSPSGLAVRVTYNGSTIAPTAIGSYPVVATVTSADYTGSARGTLVIGPALPPVITQQPAGVTIAQNGSASFSVSATGVAPLTYQWLRNGAPVAGATSATLSLSNVQPSEIGYYSVIVRGGGSSTGSRAALLEMTFSERATGGSEQVGADVHHPNGNIYDQFLLTSESTSVKAEAKKIVRASFVDLDDDIVQVEFSGAGTLTIRLADASHPAAAAKYVQPGVNYVKGHATVEITGADETSNLTIFSVGKITAVNQTLFRDDVTYDGIADIALVTIESTDGLFGSVRTGNVHYFAVSGLTGLYAPGVSFENVFIGDITGADDAIAVILTGVVNDARITGGSLEQLNGVAIEVGEIERLSFTAGQTSDGTVLPAQTNRAKFVRDAVDVTADLAP